MESSLVERVLVQAAIKHPSFRGAQYTQYSSCLIRNRLQNQDCQRSMSALGYDFDNAACESFFATPKKETSPPNPTFENLIEARRKLFAYLGSLYHSRRIHTSLGKTAPDQFYQLRLLSN